MTSPAPDPGAGAEPTLLWYVEYVRTVGSEGQMVRLSDHSVPLKEHRATLEASGFVFKEATIAGRAAVKGAVPGDTLQSLILLANGDESIMVLSYELSLNELIDLTQSLKEAGESDWQWVGGSS